MNKQKKNNKKDQALKRAILWIAAILGILYLFNLGSLNIGPPPQELSYSEFYQILKNNSQTHRISSVELTEGVARGEFSSGERFNVNVPTQDPDMLRLLRENVIDFSIRPPRTLWSNLFYSLGPMVLFILFLWYFSFRGLQGGSRLWSFGKSRARQAVEGKIKITFDDVAGVDEAKEELKEVIEFLKDPKKFQKLGGKIPKGIILIGPPGCGKTLLAKAVAGEAKVPFFSISGSDFVELFVGVGASRVRDLFEQGRRAAKLSGKGAIIFIDEIDAVGRQRFAGIGGGHDEREQTLNQLLVEMDGFDTQEGLILVAASNRPDVLDPALLRPGRFDRQIVIDQPDISGREAILRVHTRRIHLSPDVDLRSIARQTPGFSGADLANLVNEAALLAARRNKDAVTMEELQESIERVMAGPQRKSRIISRQEKTIVAYHESGHALLSLLMPGANPLQKVTILPRGMALGYTMAPPIEDRYIKTKSELITELTVLLGGRAAEELVLSEVTSGAQNDLEVATATARRMVCEFGMSEKLGHITLGRRETQVFLGRDIFEEKNYSEETARTIDNEVRGIVSSCYKRAKELLGENRDKLKLLADTLLEKEVLYSEEVKQLLSLDKEKESHGSEEGKRSDGQK
jgi:cell division protease FtsH